MASTSSKNGSPSKDPSGKSGSGFLIGTIAVVLLGGGLLFAAGNGWFSNDDEPIVSNSDLVDDDTDPETESVADADRPSAAVALGVTDEDMVDVGGVARPKRDIEFGDAITKTEGEIASPLPFPGHSPFLTGDENAQVAGLVQEISSQAPEKTAVSSMFKPEEFDAEQYAENPNTYLEKVRPGRVTAGLIEILAASPVNSGQARYRLDVVLPD